MKLERAQKADENGGLSGLGDSGDGEQKWE